MQTTEEAVSIILGKLYRIAPEVEQAIEELVIQLARDIDALRSEADVARIRDAA